MAIQQTPQSDEFKQQIRNSLQLETRDSHAIKVARHDDVYTTGDQDDTVYFIESGQIKLRMLSSEGKECLLAIHSDGDIFGELCLSGIGARSETATAMKATSRKRIPCAQFFDRLSVTRCSRVWCATWRRIADQNSKSSPTSSQSIANSDWARRCYSWPAPWVRKIRTASVSTSGYPMKNCPRWSVRRGPGECVHAAIHNLGSIETNKDRFFIIKEKKLADYLAQIA